MARKRNSDGSRDPSRTRNPPLPSNDGLHRSAHNSEQVRNTQPTGTSARADAHGSPDSRGTESELLVGTNRDPNLWLPLNCADMDIYQKMLKIGAIRPYKMPAQVERLAEHLCEMMDDARVSGRSRDALKCVELLRTLAKDNREIALEMDKIARLDAGKPTSIMGQVSTETQDRIKRIISTQRAAVLATNTEDGSHDNPIRDATHASAAEGARSDRLPSTDQVANSKGHDDRDSQTSPIERILGTKGVDP